MRSAPSPRNILKLSIFFKRNGTGNAYLQMLQDWLIDGPIANEHQDFIFRQERGPYLNRSSLCEIISMTIWERDRFGVQIGNEDNVLLKLPPRPPDLAPSDWGYMKGLISVTPSSCKARRFRAESHCRTGECCPKHTVMCLEGARLLTCCVPLIAQCAYWTLVKSFIKYTYLRNSHSNLEE